MTPEAQRTAIAESLGWTNRPSACGKVMKMWHNPDGTPIGFLPDYLNDLNAMHEAEKVMPYGKLGDYLNRLVELTGYCDTKTWTKANFDLNTATAAQRAEAFLRTLNLWVEPTTAPKGS